MHLLQGYRINSTSNFYNKTLNLFKTLQTWTLFFSLYQLWWFLRSFSAGCRSTSGVISSPSHRRPILLSSPKSANTATWSHSCCFTSAPRSTPSSTTSCQRSTGAQRANCSEWSALPDDQCRASWTRRVFQFGMNTAGARDTGKASFNKCALFNRLILTRVKRRVNINLILLVICI